MAVVVQCPHCSKKLKMKAAPAGKKVRCPACKEAFAPQPAAARPRPKQKPKPKPVADDYVDFGDDDLYGDEDVQDDGYDEGYDQPAPAKRPAGRRSSATAGKKKNRRGGTGKSGSQSKSKTPLIIGIVVVVLIAVGVGIFFAMQGDGTDDADAVADTDPTMTDPTMTDPTMTDPNAMADPAAQSSDASGDATPDSVTESAVSGSGGAQASATTTMTPMSSTGAATATAALDPTYLPTNSELFAVVDVERLLSGPLGTLLPMMGPQVHEMKQKVGIAPEDIATVTVGVGGVSKAIGAARPPQPEDTPAIAVIRTKADVDATRLQSAVPNAEQVSRDGISYIRIPADPPAALWVADARTVVIGVEAVLLKTAAGGSSASSFDPALMDPETAIRVSFQPTDPEAVFRSGKLPPPPPLPGVTEMFESIKSIRPGMTAAGFGMDLGQDVKIFGAIKSKDDQAAAATQTALESFVENAKKVAEQQAGGREMPGISMAMGGGADSLETFEVSTAGNLTSFSMVQKDGGQQLLMVAPMIMAGVQNAQQAAQQVSERNDLKQVGLAMHNFHSAWGRFPNAIPKDASGKPLLSWRVHILEFLGPQEQALYQRFNLEEPWDSATNKPLLTEMPDVFKTEGSGQSAGQTQVQLPIGPGTIFENGEGRGLRDITDGSSNTILIVETSPANAVNWTEPADWTFDPEQPAAGLESAGGTFRAAMADGAVRRVANNLSPEVLRALFSRAAGDFVPPDALQSGGGGSNLSGGFGPSAGATTESQIVGTTSNGIPMTTADWRDAEGNVLFEAQLVDFKDGNVHLKRTDTGEVVVKPLDELDESDQEMIRFFADK